MRGVIVDERWLGLFRSLSPQQLRVACHVMVACAIGGTITMSRRALAKHLGVALTNVQDALGKMGEAGLLVEESGQPMTMRTTGIHGLSISEIDGRALLEDSPRTPAAPDSGEESNGNAPTGSVVTYTPRTGSRTPIAVDESTDPRTEPRTAQPFDPSKFTSSRSANDVQSPNQQLAKLATDDAEKQGYLFSRSPPRPTLAPKDPGNGTTESKMRTPTGGRAGTRRPSLPPQALAAADLLREEILRAQPGHQIRNRAPWETNALRYTWARDLDIIARLDGRTWVDIEAMIRWLWEAQTGEYRFEVESPDALRRKWDRVSRAMGRRDAGDENVPASVTSRREARVAPVVDLGVPISRK